MKFQLCKMYVLINYQLDGIVILIGRPVHITLQWQSKLPFLCKTICTITCQSYKVSGCCMCCLPDPHAYIIHSSQSLPLNRRGGGKWGHTKHINHSLICILLFGVYLWAFPWAASAGWHSPHQHIYGGVTLGTSISSVHCLFIDR